MILGLILANATAWDAFDQRSFLPASLRGSLDFAVAGSPAAHGCAPCALVCPLHRVIARRGSRS